MKLKKIIILMLMITMCLGSVAIADTSENQERVNQENEISIPGNGVVKIQLPKWKQGATVDSYIVEVGQEEKIYTVHNINSKGILRLAVPDMKLIPGRSYVLHIQSDIYKEDIIRPLKVKNHSEMESFTCTNSSVKEEFIQDLIGEYELGESQYAYYAHGDDEYYIKYNNNYSGKLGSGMLWRRNQKKQENQFMNINEIKSIIYADDQWCYLGRQGKARFGSDLYKISRDGSKLIRISEEESIFLGVVEGKLYYIESDPHMDWKLVELDLNSGEEKILKDYELLEVYYDRDYVARELDKFLSDCIDEKLKETLLNKKEYIREILENHPVIEKDLKRYSSSNKKKDANLKEELNIEIKKGISEENHYDGKFYACMNFMMEDENYIYYHDGSVYSYVKGRSKGIYQEEACSIYRKNKKSGKAEIIAENVNFKNPQDFYYSSKEVLMQDLSKVGDMETLGDYTCGDMENFEDLVSDIFLKNNEIHKRYSFKLLFENKDAQREKLKDVKYNINHFLIEFKNIFNRSGSEFSLIFYTDIIEDRLEVEAEFVWNNSEYFQEMEGRGDGDRECVLQFKDIEDSLIRRKVRMISKILDFNFSSGLTEEELKNIEFIDIEKNKGEREIDLNALKHLKYLTQISIKFNGVKNLEALKEMKELDSLCLSSVGLKDIGVIGELTQLRYLNIGSNEIEDISHLKNLKNLESLYLQNNPIKDITPLCELQNLESLYLGNMDVDLEDIRAIYKNLEFKDFILPTNIENEVLVVSDEFYQQDNKYTDEMMGDKVFIVHNNGKPIKTDFIDPDRNPMGEKIYGIIISKETTVTYCTNIEGVSLEEIIQNLRDSYENI